MHEKLFPGLEVLQQELEERGIDPELITEPDFYDEIAALERIKPDIWYCDSSQKIEAVRHGQPYLMCMAEAWGYPTLGFKGTIPWAEQTVRVLENAEIYEKLEAPDMYLPGLPCNYDTCSLAGIDCETSG
jgi:hypothetical protein